MPAERKEHRDQHTVADLVAEWMHNNNPAWTVDTLLSRPIDALRMGLNVARRQQKITIAEANDILIRLQEIVDEYPEQIDAIDAVCAAAINARKRGHLKRDPV